jgi:parvulin-like peptidyl-prolyl isomerase
MPNQVHSAHIPVKTEKAANAVLERLKKGESFANVAKDVSLYPSKKKRRRSWNVQPRKNGERV